MLPTLLPPMLPTNPMVSNGSESDDEVIDELMSLLEGQCGDSEPHHEEDATLSKVPQLLINYKHKTLRDQLEKSVCFQNFKLGPNGHQNHRDATVLGNPPGIIIPTSLRKYESFRLGIYLDTEYVEENTNSYQVKAPVFCNPNMKTIHSEMSCTNPLEPHELWIQTDALGPEFTIFFKKRCWELSRRYRKVSGTQWPQFVIVVTPTIQGKLAYNKSVCTLPFEIRSKEQSNKAAAARGLSNVTVTKRRRTPITEEAASKLHKIQANIIQLRAQIANEKQWSTDFETRIRFMTSIAATNPAFHQLRAQMAKSFARIQQNSKHRRN